MIGYVVGGLGILGLAALARSHRYLYGYGGCGGYGGRFAHGGPCGHGRHGWGGHGWHGGSGHRWGRRRMAMHHLFYRLDTTPGQEKAFAAAMEQLHETGRPLREGWRELRKELARLFRADSFDAAAASAALKRLDGLWPAFREQLIEQARQVHSALDPSQRTEVGAILEGWGS